MDLLERNSGFSEHAAVNFSANVVNDFTFDGTVGTFFSILANLALVMLFISPVPTIRRILEKKSTEELFPYPYVAAAMYFAVWVVYGLQLHPPPYALRLFCLQISSLLGCIIFTYYYVVFGFHSTTRQQIIVFFLPVVVACVWMPTYGFFLRSWMNNIGDAYIVICTLRSHLLGPLAVLLGAFMYGSPLFVIKRVYMTRSVEYVPFWFSLACFLNALLWFIYACLPQTFDLYIAIANGIGTVFGFLQLVVFFMFSTNWSKSSESSKKGYVKPNKVMNTNPNKKKKKKKKH